MDWSDLLWSHTWWEYQPDCSWSDRIWQHWFNLFEGVCWLIFAGLVAFRQRRHGRARWLESSYAAAFVAFGASDFVQAFRLTSWLLVWKLINLILLLWLRRRTMTQLYPESRIY